MMRCECRMRVIRVDLAFPGYVCLRDSFESTDPLVLPVGNGHSPNREDVR